MHIEYLPHQRAAISFLSSGKGGILALPCGAGKTLISLTHLSLVSVPGLRLIVLPKSLVGVWKAENAKWGMFPELCEIRSGGAAWDEAFASGNGTFAISYEKLLRDATPSKTHPFERRIASHVFACIVADESSKIKSPTAKLTKMFMKLRSAQKVLLNATVIENSLGDVWSQAESVRPGILYGNFWVFRRNHAVMNEYFPGVKEWKDKEKAIGMIRPVMLSFSKDDVNASLPPMTEQFVSVPMKPEQRRVYDRARKELLLEVEGEDVPIANAIVKLMRLRQLSNGLWTVGTDGESGKMDVLAELLSQFGTEKSIIFTQFAETADAISSSLGIRHVVKGDTSGRRGLVDDWKENGTALIGTSALFRGENLQAARFVVFFDLPWTHSAYEQAYSRAYRTGQSRPVTVYALESEKSVDTVIRKMVFDKKADGDLLSRLTRADIEKILCSND